MRPRLGGWGSTVVLAGRVGARACVACACACIWTIAAAAPAAHAQAPVPVSAMRGQNATPHPVPPPPEARAAALARLHHAAMREVQLGEVGAVGGDAPSVRRYGADLAARFRAFDRRVLAFAQARGLAQDELAALFAGENLDALRREAEDMSRLGAARGAAFDRAFWLAVAQEQSAAADMIAAAATPSAPTDPALRDQVLALAPELDAASRAALVAAAAP
jgi:hypothetical protein